jgi:hypothetical protein
MDRPPPDIALVLQEFAEYDDKELFLSLVLMLSEQDWKPAAPHTPFAR